MKHSTRPVVILDSHPDVIGHATVIDAITMGFDGRSYRRTGKLGHSLHDSTPVAEYSDDADHRIWIDPLRDGFIKTAEPAAKCSSRSWSNRV